MANRNPWLDMEPMSAGVRGRRVDALHPWPFYWALEGSGRYLFVFESSHPATIPEDIAEFGGISVNVYLGQDKRCSVVLELHDTRDWEIFLSLCTDLLEATLTAGSGLEAFNTLIQRLRRWRRLLQNARKDRLSDAEILGLFGELSFLADVLGKRFGIEAAVAAWQGPTGDAPQDFCIGTTAVEVKARLGTTKGRVEISSLDQLQSSMARLLLHVVTFGVAPPGRSSLSLSGAVAAIRTVLVRANAAAASEFDEKLYAAGYSDAIDYTGPEFEIVARDFYSVGDGFPRLQRKDIVPAILEARYSLDLGQCTGFLVADPWGA